jgi:uncharacterized protein (DUF885 family)
MHKGLRIVVGEVPEALLDLLAAARSVIAFCNEGRLSVRAVDDVEAMTARLRMLADACNAAADAQLLQQGLQPGLVEVARMLNAEAMPMVQLLAASAVAAGGTRAGGTLKTVERDSAGNIVRVVERPMESGVVPATEQEGSVAF